MKYSKLNLFLCLDIVLIFLVSYCDDVWNLYYKAKYEGFNGVLFISITGNVLLKQLWVLSNLLLRNIKKWGYLSTALNSYSKI